MPVRLDDNRRRELDANFFYTPRCVWLIFVATCFVTFFDRGAVSGALQQIRQDEDISGSTTEVLSSTKAGLLTSVFMIGFLIFSPIFTALAGTLTTRTILVIGMVLWIVSVIATGVAPNYGALLAARAVTGIGEAAYTPCMVTVIDNIAPTERRTLWLGIWYAMLAVGTAGGMGGGGAVAAKVQLGDTPGWRLTFFLEAGVGCVLCALLLFLPRDYNIYDLGPSCGDDIDDGDDAGAERARQQQRQRAYLLAAERDANGSANDESFANDDGAGGDRHVPIMHAMSRIIRIPDFLLLAFGYAAYDYFLGAVAAWMIQAATQSSLALGETEASVSIGGSMMFCGLVGSMVGGMAADRLTPATHPECVPRAAFMAGLFATIGLPAAAVALVAQKLWLYFVALVPGVFMHFALVPPLTVALLGVVPTSLRPYSISTSMVIMHVLGDAISPTIVGAISTSFSGLCHDAPETVCAMLDFSNATYDREYSWLDGDCRWIGAQHKGDTPYCTNTMQLPKALLTALAVGTLMVPLWWTVALRRKWCCPQHSDDAAAA